MRKQDRTVLKAIAVSAATALLAVLCIVPFLGKITAPHYFSFDYRIDCDDGFSVYWATPAEPDFSEQRRKTVWVRQGEGSCRFEFPDTPQLAGLRLDLGDAPGRHTIVLRNMALSGTGVDPESVVKFFANDLPSRTAGIESTTFERDGGDSYFVLDRKFIPGLPQTHWPLAVPGALFFLFFTVVMSLTCRPKSALPWAAEPEPPVSRRRRIGSALFLLAGAVLILLPALKFSRSEVAANENRTLAKFPAVSAFSPLAPEKWCAAFEAACSDRFFLRETMIDFRARISKLFDQRGGTRDVLIGRDGWLFLNNVPLFANLRVLPEEDMAAALAALTRAKRQLEARGVRLYLLIVPDSYQVYGEFYPVGFSKVRPVDQNGASRLVRYLRANGFERCLYPYDIAVEEKARHGETPLYYRQDTHWNDLGARYVGYLPLVKMIAADFPGLSAVPVLRPREGEGAMRDLARLLPPSSRPSPETVPYLDYDLSEVRTGEKFTLLATHASAENPRGRLKLVAYRDSFFIALFPPVAGTFRKCDLFWRFPLPEDKALLEDADVVVIEMAERFIENLKEFNLPE